ncbi:immunoglobulin domain-containing protein [Roseibacillus persicicus]|nr:immunoglobulin domain-containing protein [Roseibacillus persicicus]
MNKLLLSLTLLSLPLRAAPDTVDQAFASTAGSFYDEVQLGGPASMLIQPDGKLLVGSNWMSAQNGTLYTPLVRFNLDGTTDHTFHADATPNGQGSGIFYDLPGQPEVHGLALQSDGKIIAVGCMQGMRDGVTTGSSTNALISNGIVRITANGDPDVTFQSAGIDTEFIDEVVTTSDDKIIIAGGFNSVRNQGGSFISREGIARLNADGSLDTSFQVVPSSLGSFDAGTLFIRQVAPTANGKYYIVGSARPAGGTFSDSAPILARINSDGSLDGSFAPSFPQGVDSFSGVVLEPAGTIVALGSYGNTASSNNFMGRFTETGSPSGSFTLDASLPKVSARPLRQDPLGRFLLSKRDPSLGNTQLVRINNDGSLDATFNASGTGITGNNTAYFNQSITSPTGKIYAGGSFSGVNGEPTIKIAAFEGDYIPNSPGTIQMGTFAVSAAECDLTLRVPVTRIGGATGAATVDYSFADINATAGSDYTTTAGTISFAAGEAGTKYIDVALTADALVETLEVFTVTLSNPTGATLGTTVETYATIIDSNSPPLIIAEPSPLYVPPFEFFQLAVGAISGKDPTTYQWFKDGSPISGATSPLYFATNANAAQHDGDYTVTVTNPNGTVTSAVATVVVKDPADLSFALSSTSAIESDGTLEVTLTRSGSSVNAVSVDVTAFAGTASSADYSFATQTVSWADGDLADKTITVTLTDDSEIESTETLQLVLVNYSPDARPGTNSSILIEILDDDTPLTIATQPLPSQQLQEDETLTLTVTADSPTPLSYQWLRDGTPLPGEVAATLTLDPVTLAGSGSYTVEVTNAAGTVTSDSAEVLVKPAPYFATAAPPTPDLDQNIFSIALIDNQTAWVAGQSSTLGFIIQKVSLDPTVPVVTITLNSQAEQVVTLPGGGVAARGYFTTVNGQSQSFIAKFNPDGTLATGQITSNLTKRPSVIAVDDAGRILVGEGTSGVYETMHRFNADGSLDAAFPQVSFGYNPNIESILVDGSHIYVGGRFTSSGTGTAGNYLTKLNDDGTRDESFNFTTNVLPLAIEKMDDGKLAILAQQSFGTVSQWVRIINPDGSLDTSPASLGSLSYFDLGVDDNGTIYSPRANTPYLAVSNGDPDFTTKMGPFNNVVSSIEVDQAGRVWVAGAFTTLNGNPVPHLVVLNGTPGELAIVEHPSLVAAEVGESASFSVDAVSSGTIAYQWRKDGVDLPGETGSTLTVGSLAPSDSAFYDVVVTNTETNLTLPSNLAELIVLGAPEVRESPASKTLIVGDGITLQPKFYASSPYTLQWQKNGVDIPGANSATYEISSSELTDSGNYTLAITNALGSASTVPANIQFIPDPTGLVDGFVPASYMLSYPEHITPTPDGGAYLGGNFYNITHPAGAFNDRLAKVDASGAPVTSFAPATNNGSANRSTDAALDSSGLPILVSTQNSYGFLINGNYYHVVKLNADGTNHEPFTTNADAAINTAFGLVAVDSLDRVYLGGFNNIDRLNADGTLDATYAPTFSGTPLEMMLTSDGKLLVMTSSSLQRFNADGSLDTTFILDPSIGTTPAYVTFDVGLDGHIHLAAANSTAQRIHQLSADGTLLSTIDNLGFTGSNTLYDIAVQPNGKYLTAHSQAPYLSRVLSDGSPDPLFDIGTGFNSPIRKIEVTEDGKIWVSGGFNTFKGVTHYGYALLNGDPVDVIILEQPGNTFADLGSTAELSISASGLGGAPVTFQWLKDGLELTGETSATLTIANAQESDEGRYEVVITNTITGRDRTSSAATLTVLAEPEILTFSETTFDLEVGDALELSVSAQGAGTLTYQWKKDGVDIPGATSETFAISMTEETDTGVYSVVVTNSFGDTSSDAVTVTVVFAPAAISPDFDDRLVFNSTIYAILPLPDGRTLVGGGFSSITFDGQYYPIDELALLNADGSLDTTMDFNPNGQVRCLTLTPDGKILVGGTFQSIGGATRRRVARLNADLSIDPGFDPGVGANNTVYDLQPTADGKVLAGGIFNQFNSDSNFAYLVRLNADGSLDEDFSPPSLNTIYRVIPLPNNQVLVGGAFSAVASGSYITRLNSDGTRDSSYQGTHSNHVYTMALQPDGKLLLAGRFGRLRRLLDDGTEDPTFSTSLNGDAWSLAVDSAGKILVGGNFTEANNESSSSIARLNSDGTTDTSFDVQDGANSVVQAIALQPLGRIWLGGGFSTYRGSDASRLVLLNGNPLELAIVSHPSSTAIDPGTTATFSVTAAATDTINYQWQKNGSDLTDTGDISGTTSNTLSIANADENAEGEYRVIVTHSTTNETLTSNSAELVVLGAPEILAQPEDLTVETGFDSVFTVDARGASPVSYQWFKDGSPLSDDTNITGATTAELTLSDLSLEDSGTVFVRISNGLGSVDSLTVDLDVVRLPASRDRSIVLPSFNSTVRALYPNDDGSFVAGGFFTSLTHPNGSSSRRYLTKINADGTPDLTFPQVVGNGNIASIDIDSNGRYLVGGRFTQLNANGSFVNINYIARINSDGTIDSTFDPGTGPNSDILQVKVLPNNQVMVTGYFTSFAGQSGTAYVCRLNEDGSVDTSFVSQATSAVEDITCVGSDYYLAGGGYPGSTRQVRIDATGAPVSGYTYNGNLTISDVIPTNDGGVLTGSISYPYIEKVDASGNRSATWPSLANSGGPNTRVYELAQFDSTRSIIAGQFSTYSGQTMNNIVIVNSDGVPEPDFNPGSGFDGSYPEVIKVDAQGRIWCGGGFNTYNGENVGKIVVLNGYLDSPSDPYLDYLANFNLPANELGENDDPDGDDFPNLLEFIYSTDPSTGPSPEVVSDTGTSTGDDLSTAYPTLGFAAGEQYQTFTVLVPKDLQGTTLEVETSTNLQNFGDGTIDPVLLESASFNALYDIRTYAYDQPLSVAPTAYARVVGSR